ncbi:MAG: TaqI-like C-terminal specificity domain-containing protein, partial [Fimbriimonadaceae bacterium]
APGGEMRLFKWLTSGRPPETLSDEIEAAPTVQNSRLTSEDWELEPDHVISLREKLSSKGKSLRKYAGKAINRGVTTGFNDAFVISSAQRDKLIAEDASSAELIYPFLQGTHVRSWNLEQSDTHIIFARRGVDVERYPAILNHLAQWREQLEPKPGDWSKGSWPGRKAGPYKWFEIQDSTEYWKDFFAPKIVWPDITNRPRFAFDTSGSFVADTALIIPTDDAYLHGVLSSWTTWFFISKTAQPLRLRSDRWQYRLKAQYMSNIPIPDAPEPERQAIADLARTCSTLGQERYQAQIKVQRRLRDAFAGASANPLNQKAEAWWEHDLIPLGEALKQSFKLPSNPMKNPRTADEWESYLVEKRAEQTRLTAALNAAEAEINDRVYRLFDLTPDEIRLLQKEVEH